MMSQRNDFFTAGVYTGKMTTVLPGNYQGYADVTINLAENSDNGFDANVRMKLTGANCNSITKKIMFPLENIEFTAKFTTDDIKKENDEVTATVKGTANIPFVSQLPTVIKSVMKDTISSSTTIKKDATGKISTNVSVFGVATLFGDVKKQEEAPVVEAQQNTSLRLSMGMDNLD